jgi:hypothetical protein
MVWNQDFWKPTRLLVKRILQSRAHDLDSFATAMMRLLNQGGIQTPVPIPPTKETIGHGHNNIQKKDQMPLCVHSLAVISDEHSPCDLVVRLFG